MYKDKRLAIKVNVRSNVDKSLSTRSNKEQRYIVAAINSVRIRKSGDSKRAIYILAVHSNPFSQLTKRGFHTAILQPTLSNHSNKTLTLGTRDTPKGLFTTDPHFEHMPLSVLTAPRYRYPTTFVPSLLPSAFHPCHSLKYIFYFSFDISFELIAPPSLSRARCLNQVSSYFSRCSFR